MTTPLLPALAGPLDDEGLLVHEDDAAAQLALSIVNLEVALAEAGQSPTDLARLDVLTTDPAALAAVIDVLDERLAATGASPVVEIEPVDRLPVAGMLVALRPAVRHTPPRPGGPVQHRLIPPTPTRDIHREGSTMTSTTSHPSAETLRGLCDGAVHLPGDPGYDAARVPWNVAVDQRPAAVAVPRSVEDVVAVVRAAADAGLRVAPQSTGHNAGPLPTRGLSDVVLLRLHELTGVTVDPDTRTARVVGGSLWQDAAAAAAEHGLAALHGSSPDVAVAGYVLGGGLSFYARQHGLAANGVTAVELVLADGSLVRTTATEHPDLFWAVRGGGGSLGVVVAIELTLLPLADVYAGMLLWDVAHAPAVVRTWLGLTRDVPDSVTTSLRVMSFPPLPELPPFLSGRRLVVVDGAVLEDDARAAELLAPLRALSPEMDTFGRIPAPDLLAVHMDPPGPTPAVSDHAVLRELDDAAVDALLEVVGEGSTSPLMFAELRHLGGALARPADGAGVLATLPGAYLLFCVAVAPVPDAVAPGLAAAAEVVRALAPWSCAQRVLNFTEHAVDASSAYEPEAWVRLAAVRDRYDPQRVLVANHGI